jgi:hypothetical protein
MPHRAKSSDPASQMFLSALNRRHLLAGGAAITATIAAPAIVRAQGGALKVGVLLPRSGAQAGIGQDCHRSSRASVCPNCRS